jgi:hypothetical protein
MGPSARWRIGAATAQEREDRTLLATDARILLLVLLLAFPWPAPAREPVATPDELLTRADLVVNAVPTRVLPTDTRGHKGSSAVPTRLVVARLQVIGVLKGRSAGEIELRYPALDVGAVRGALVHGPLDIRLETGRRYRFYLREVPGQSWYVTALDGELDDQSAVQPLHEKEASDSPPLLRQEAMERAAAYLTLRLPSRDPAAERVVAAYRWIQPAWDFTYFTGDPASYPEGASDAEIIVAGDRSIDPRSWVADAIYRSADAIDAAAVGRAVHLVLRTPDPDDPPETVSGRVNAVAGDTIELYGSSSRSPLAQMSIPKSDIVTVVRMAE